MPALAPCGISGPLRKNDWKTRRLSPMNFADPDRLMRQALEQGVFPGAVLAVAVGPRTVFYRPYGICDLVRRQPVSGDTVFDLASMTKALATTLAVMTLVGQGHLALDRRLADLLPLFARTDKQAITIEQLLRHTAGLVAHRPFFQVLVHERSDRRRELLMALVGDEPLANPIGAVTVYSDLGFMILGWVVEALSGQRLDRFVTATVYRPLGLKKLFFVDVNEPLPVADFAATEVCPWRRRLIRGQVHDDNAWAAGGICGHAGLFGTAADVLALAKQLLAAHGGRGAGVLEPDLVRLFARRAGLDGRPLGFDAPAPMDSSCGRHFSMDSFGHLGFTGTSFWIDPARQVVVVLLTNRVHPTRDNVAIKAFRPLVHDAVMEALGLAR